jgi:hypothetical protein
MPLALRMWKAVSGVSGFGRVSILYCGVEESVSLFSERKREARAKRWRFWRMRMSQSTSSSRIRAVVRFCSTILYHHQFGVHTGRSDSTFGVRSYGFSNSLVYLRGA